MANLLDSQVLSDRARAERAARTAQSSPTFGFEVDQDFESRALGVNPPDPASLEKSTVSNVDSTDISMTVDDISWISVGQKVWNSDGTNTSRNVVKKIDESNNIVYFQFNFGYTWDTTVEVIERIIGIRYETSNAAQRVERDKDNSSWTDIGQQIPTLDVSDSTNNTFDPDKKFDTVNDLLSFDIQNNPYIKDVYIRGRNVINDGGGGFLYYDPDSTETPDNGTIFEPNSGGGRWKRPNYGYVYANWFGVDGVDDDIEINEALSLFSEVRLLPNREYNLGNSIIINDNNRLVSTQKKATLVLQDNANSDGITNKDRTNGNNNILVENVDISGNKNNQTPDPDIGFGITFRATSGNTCDGIRVINCDVHNFYRAGIEFEYANSFKVNNNNAYNNGIDGVNKVNGIAFNLGCTNGFVDTNETYGNTGNGNGWEKENCEAITYTNNIAYDNGTSGHLFGWVTSNCVISNNIAYNNSQRGFVISGQSDSEVDRISLHNNYSYGNTLDGFKLLVGKNIEMIGAISDGDGQNGLQCTTDVENLSIIGGSFNSNSSDGLQLNNTGIIKLVGVETKDNTNNGITSNGQTSGFILGSVIYGNGSDGIYLNDCNLAIYNSYISNNGSYGINEVVSSGNNFIHNQISNNTSGSYGGIGTGLIEGSYKNLGVKRLTLDSSGGTFSVEDGDIHIINPLNGNRNYEPSGAFSSDQVIIVSNISTDNSELIFDPLGLDYRILPTEVIMFIYIDGNWKVLKDGIFSKATGVTKDIDTGETFSSFDGEYHFITPIDSNRNYDPTGIFPKYFKITILNKSSTYDIIFDSSGINKTISSNTNSSFVYDGNVWNEI